MKIIQYLKKQIWLFDKWYTCQTYSSLSCIVYQANPQRIIFILGMIDFLDPIKHHHILNNHIKWKTLVLLILKLILVL